MSSLTGQHAEPGAAPRRGLPTLRPGAKTAILTELADLLEAGCQLERALAVLSRQLGDEPSRRVVDALRGQIVEGAGFADAMARAGQNFPRVQVAMVRASEAGGFLQRTLRHLAEQGQRQAENVSQIRKAMTYPAFLALTSLASVVFLLVYVVPNFTTIYQASGRTLPLPTRALVMLSSWAEAYWWALLLAAAVVLTVGRLAAQSQELRLRWDRLVLRMPVVGPLLRDWELSRFARSMAMLLDGGLGAVQALELTGEVLGNRAMRGRVRQFADAVRSGQPMSSQLRDSWPFPLTLGELISVGEESGRLPQVFDRLAEQLYRRFHDRLETAMSLVEPIVILVVGAAIGLIVAAMLLPVLLMNTLVT